MKIFLQSFQYTYIWFDVLCKYFLRMEKSNCINQMDTLSNYEANRYTF